MSKVHTLKTTETSAIDTDALQKLKCKVGEKRCRSVVDGMIFAITDGLCQIERAVQERDYDALPAQIDSLYALAHETGLVCMTDVIADLDLCCERGDDVALAAVAARLVRIGEDSLFNLIAFADRSIM